MSRLAATDKWFSFVSPRSGAALRFFCFPYAGGGASIFRDWGCRLPGHIETCPVQLPGRETRFREPAFTHVEPLVEALAQSLRPKLDRPFAFFGHSLGALVAFELSRRLKHSHGLQPIRLFVSGCEAPQTRSPGKTLHALPSAEFREELRRLHGTPTAVLENEELMELMLPTLRADFSLWETYAFTADPLLTCPIIALGGLGDDLVSRKELQAWHELTTGLFRLRMLPGDHFFLNSALPLLIRILAQELLEAKDVPTPRQPSILSVREERL